MHTAQDPPTVCRKGGVVTLRVQDLVHLHHTIVSLARCAPRFGETPYRMSNMSKLKPLASAPDLPPSFEKMSWSPMKGVPLHTLKVGATSAGHWASALIGTGQPHPVRRPRPRRARRAVRARRDLLRRLELPRLPRRDLRLQGPREGFGQILPPCGGPAQNPLARPLAQKVPRKARSSPLQDVRQPTHGVAAGGLRGGTRPLG